MTEIELTALLFNLHDLGITGIKIRYQGENGFSEIDWIGYTKTPCRSPRDVIDIVEDWQPEHNLNKLGSPLYIKVESLAFTIHQKMKDWSEDLGGYGDIGICIPSGKYKIYHNIRIMETEQLASSGEVLSIPKEGTELKTLKIKN
jgi:hypothetical protein